ncbi:hypothetical protein TNCV_5013091 [Trichonephila clavipes]|nr:hypothetical protein TNCV_5013091 [Trichonephila clavipes]
MYALTEFDHFNVLGEGSCGSPVVKVLDHGRHVMSSSPVPLKIRRVEMNQTCFQNEEDWPETNITGNNSSRWYFLTSSQVNWADIQNFVEFLSREMPDIKIDDNDLFEEEKQLNRCLNSNTLEQLENQHAEIDKRWVKKLKPF